VDELKRIRSALASGESVLTDADRSAILASAQAMEFEREFQVQMILSLRLRRREGETLCSS
jgi:hypothetical protein